MMLAVSHTALSAHLVQPEVDACTGQPTCSQRLFEYHYDFVAAQSDTSQDAPAYDAAQSPM